MRRYFGGGARRVFLIRTSLHRFFTNGWGDRGKRHNHLARAHTRPSHVCLSFLRHPRSFPCPRARARRERARRWRPRPPRPPRRPRRPRRRGTRGGLAPRTAPPTRARRCAPTERRLSLPPASGNIARFRLPPDRTPRTGCFPRSLRVLRRGGSAASASRDTTLTGHLPNKPYRTQHPCGAGELVDSDDYSTCSLTKTNIMDVAGYATATLTSCPAPRRVRSAVQQHRADGASMASSLLQHLRHHGLDRVGGQPPRPRRGMPREPLNA